MTSQENVFGWKYPLYHNTGDGELVFSAGNRKSRKSLRVLHFDEENGPIGCDLIYWWNLPDNSDYRSWKELEIGLEPTEDNVAVVKDIVKRWANGKLLFDQPIKEIPY